MKPNATNFNNEESSSNLHYIGCDSFIISAETKDYAYWRPCREEICGKLINVKSLKVVLLVEAEMKTIVYTSTKRKITGKLRKRTTKVFL